MAATTTIPNNNPIENGSKNKRRRYFANGRSRTIELSTLAEIDEEEFAKSEGVSTDNDTRILTTQDDMCIGTTNGAYKSLKRGSVKAQAMKLSERLAQRVTSDRITKEQEDNETEKPGCSKPIDVKIRRNMTEIRRESRHFETNEYGQQQQQPSEWPQQQQQQHEYLPNCSIPIPRHPISRSASFVTPTPLIVYGMPPPNISDRMSMIDGRCDSRMGEYAMPLYYMPAPPQPQPLFLPFNPKMAQYDHQGPTNIMMMPQIAYDIPPQMRRKMKTNGKNKKESWCSRICCAGFAQLLWTIVCIISFGIIASLILALCYM